MIFSSVWSCIYILYMSEWIYTYKKYEEKNVDKSKIMNIKMNNNKKEKRTRRIIISRERERKNIYLYRERERK